MELRQPSAIARALVEQARRTPDRQAVWDRTRSVSYAEFEETVAGLAARICERRGDLGACGVLPIVTGRDVGSVVAINAAIRAGVAFAPIDAGSAPAVVTALLARLDSPRLAVVAEPGFADVLPARTRAIGERDPGLGVVDPQPVDPAALSRVMFTSGSSGEPKGVMLDWRSIDAFADDPLVAVPPGFADYRALNVAPFSFGAGVVMAIRPALGTALSIVDPNVHEPAELFEIYDRERINAVVVVASHVTSALDRWPTGRRLEHASSVSVFGEPMEWPMVAVLRRVAAADAVVANVYGATESGGVVLALRIDATMPTATGRVPLGRPLGPDLVRLDPISDEPGAPAEIVVRGPRVAMGYWRDRALTARAFGVDTDGTRFWRSGDLVRPDDEGLLHFVGRRDNVVKINGKLVEPSEPERVLGSIPGVRRGVVLVQPAPRGGSRLVAHLEVDDTGAPTPAEVRTAVVDRVAAHLVPAVLVRHDHLPLTERGKVDRQRLIAQEVVPWYRRSSERRPVSFEVAVLDVVSGIVGHRAAGPDDDLWEAGLDSLGAAELLAALQDFGWPALPESVLLEHRSAAALNALRAEMLPDGEAIWLNREGLGRPVVCILPAASDALTFRRLAREVGGQHPVAIVRQFDPRSQEPPLRTVEDIAGALVARLRPALAQRDAAVVGYSASGVVAYEVARLLRIDGGRAETVLLDAPAGATTVRGRTASSSTTRRLRSAARQAWLRALPPMTMPQRERAYARFEIAARAAERNVPVPSDVPVTLFWARHGGLGSLAEDWASAASDLTVLDLDCDHYEILDLPAIAAVADRVRGQEAAVRA